MRFFQSAMLGMAVFALAAGPAWAADTSADEKHEAGIPNAAPAEELTFADLDRNNNGYLTKAEAAADKELAKNFDKFDLNHDGKLSRAEYRKARGQPDISPVAKKSTGKDKAKKPVSGAIAAPKP